jgi:hypothetical protein
MKPATFELTPLNFLVDLDADFDVADFDVADIFEFSDSLPVQLAQDLFLGNIPFTNDNARDNENCASTGTCFDGDSLAADPGLFGIAAACFMGRAHRNTKPRLCHNSEVVA